MVSSFLLSACSDDTASSHKRAKTAHLVETQQAQIQAVRTQLKASGSLKAKRKVRIYNELSARIVELPYYPGDHVNKEDVLVRLDDSIISAELDKAIAGRKQAESDYKRLKTLKPKKLASDEEIAQAATALEIARAEEKLQRARFAQTTLRAPFAGQVTERLFEPGDVVALHSQLLSLIDPDSLLLEIKLAERWMTAIAIGDYVSVTIDALGTSQHDGRISRIYPGIDENTRKGTIEISLEPQPFGAQIGQLARVELFTHSVDKLVVPAHSIHHDSKGAYVYIIDDDSKVQKNYVVKGHQYGDQIAIVSGLDVNSSIVTKGFIGLRNGKSVTVARPEILTTGTDRQP